MTLAAWLHDLDPVAFTIPGGFAVRWYGLAYLCGFAVAYLLMRTLARRGVLRIPPHRVPDALMWLVGGVIVGGRLVYVLVYSPELLWTFSGSPPWWGLLAINKGGMASHGGILGVIVATWRIGRGWKEQDEAGNTVIVGRCGMLHVLDVAALACTPGLFFGRIANFINGELLGRIITPPGVPGPSWSVQYPQELLAGKHAPPLSAEQSLELARLAEQAAPGGSFTQGVERLIANAGVYADALKPLLASRHPSQLYQAAAEGLILGCALLLIWMKPRKPGVIGAWFLIIYGVLRIATEYWRLPDPQFADGRPWGLSRGQWLSVGMIAAGTVGLYFVTRRNVPKIGGWLRRRSATG